METKNYDLFISYAKADREWVEGYLFDALKKTGVNYSSEENFKLGVFIPNEFERLIKESKRTLLIFSSAYLADPKNQFVNSLSEYFGLETATWPIIPLYLESNLKVPTRLRGRQGLDAATPEQWKKAIKRLCEDLDIGIPTEAKIPKCPYPGMSPFKEEDSDRFFGRSDEIVELVNRLRSSPFLAVIGPSGSGKSSLVLAGLIPALRNSQLFGSGEWLVKIVRPGAKPLTTLKSKLNSDLSNLPQAVTELLKTHLHAERLLLIIDQFEEVFTIANKEPSNIQKQEFIPFQNVLLDLSKVKNCYVVLTVRSDFYTNLIESSLWHKIKSHRFEIAPLNEEGLRKAIVQPADDLSVFIESALVERLVTDSVKEKGKGILPLLQETLVLLWQYIERRYLPLNAYNELTLILPRNVYGHKPTGLEVAIALQADAALGDLSNEQEATIARRIFLRLVQFGEGRKDTRRQQIVTALRSTNEDSHLFERVLEHLVKRRLLTKSGEESEEQKVDIAHEALITGWPTLQQWIAERGEAEQNRRRLTQKAKEWVRLGKGESGLLDEGELKEANVWLKSSDAIYLGLDETLIELVTASEEHIREIEEGKKAAQERELELIRERLEQEKRATEQEKKARQAAQRVNVLLFTVALIIVLVGGFVWWKQEETQQAVFDAWSSYDTATQNVANRSNNISFLKHAQKRAERYKKGQEIARALAYYQQIRADSVRMVTPSYYLTKSGNIPQDKSEIYQQSLNAEQKIVEIIREYRLDELKQELEQRKFGKVLEYTYGDIDKRFTPGALKISYKLIMLSNGARGDINHDGKLASPEEATQIPCETLKDIEKLWLQVTDNRCGWSGLSSSYTKYPTECMELNGLTLTTSLFHLPFESLITDRLKSCNL